MSLLLEFHHPDTGLAVVFDDDGRVAWAYLRTGDGDVIADVWLYNHGPAPREADWTDRRQVPFLNPSSLARDLEQPPARHPKDVAVEWTLDGELLLADILLRGSLLARLSPGSQPGWSTLAKEDGPCARVLPS
ncbi:MAG: hypothetical protein IT380_17845 [Myxococcales bacterium]|nr:hypothetical protein [Myxococcales bacterium]